MMVNVVTGFPAWPCLYNKDYVFALDTFIWAVLNLYSHGSTVIKLFCDERSVKLDEEKEPLWCMLHRKSGLSQLLFKSYVQDKFSVATYTSGTIIDECKDEALVGLILDGTAKVEMRNSSRLYYLHSGGFLGIQQLHLFHNEGANFSSNHSARVTCMTDVTIYRCSEGEITALAKCPETKSAFQALLIYALTDLAERLIVVPVDERNMVQPTERSPIFSPLEEWEKPECQCAGSGEALHNPLYHILSSAVNSFLAPWPFHKWLPGLRHSKMPAPHLCPAKETNDNQNDVTEETSGCFDVEANQSADLSNESEIWKPNDYGAVAAAA